MNRTTALRVLALALIVGAATDLLFRADDGLHAIGINAPIALGLLLLAGALAGGAARLRRIDPADWWLAPLAMAFAAGLAIRADPVLALVNTAGALALGTCFLLALAGIPVTRASISAVVPLPFEAAVAAIAGGAPVIGAARPAPGARARLRHAPSGAAPVLRGLLLVLPLVAVFAGLFAAADAVFADAAGRILELPFRLPIMDLAGHIAWIAVVAWPVAGLLTLAAGLMPRLFPPEPAAPAARGQAGDAATEPAAAVQGPAGQTEALVILVVLDLLFAVFVVLQVAYLFGGEDTRAATGLTYAEYARRGFFELLAASGLAALVVAGVEWIVPGGRRLQRVAGISLLALTGVVLVSSFLRLRLYQEMYGWTELRFWVLLSIGWLGASLVAMAGLVALRRSTRLAHAVVVLGIAAMLLANAVAPQRVVAEQNLARALDPALVPPGGEVVLDEGYLGDLGEDAVPVVVDALPRLPAGVQAPLRRHLAERRAVLAEAGPLQGWPAWNLARARAVEALDRIALP